MRSFRLFLMIALSVASGACLAHTGSHPLEGFVDGLTHPFAGPDHVLAMLGVGLWAVLLPGAVWRLPLVFMTLMCAGGALGAAGFSLKGGEAGIAASVLALGLLVAARLRLALPVAAGLTGLFALFHGVAHGAEIASGSGFAAYAAGFVVATFTLHLAGILSGRSLLRLPLLYRAIGGMMGLSGALLLLQAG